MHSIFIDVGLLFISMEIQVHNLVFVVRKKA